MADTEQLYKSNANIQYFTGFKSVSEEKNK